MPDLKNLEKLDSVIVEECSAIELEWVVLDGPTKVPQMSQTI